MHMADALLSPAVAGVMTTVSAGTIVYSVAKIKRYELDDKKIPMMGVMGAFVFAAQMINFSIPMTGSSGHIGGGILLAALLGSCPAFLTIAAVLMIQAFFFADGGILALGCNLFNMGFYACFLAYPFIFKAIVKKGLNAKRITTASIVSVVVGLQLGAFSVVMETLASGITELPFNMFVMFMQPIHLAIGLAEGIITAGVLCFVYNVRPEILESAVKGTRIGAVPIKKVLAGLMIAAAITGGVLSVFASSYPDGLEWSMEGITGSTELEAKGSIHEKAAKIQNLTAFLPDYSFPSPNEESTAVGTGTSGLTGGILTLVVAGFTGWAISFAKKRKRSKFY